MTLKMTWTVASGILIGVAMPLWSHAEPLKNPVPTVKPSNENDAHEGRIYQPDGRLAPYEDTLLTAYHYFNRLGRAKYCEAILVKHRWFITKPTPFKRELASPPDEIPMNYEDALVAAAHHFADEVDLGSLATILARQPAIIDARDHIIFGKPTGVEDHTMLHKAAESGKVKVVAFLLSHKANPNATCEWGWTPLHFAAKAGNLEIVKLLVQHGANVDAKTKVRPAMAAPCQMAGSPGILMPAEPSVTPLELAAKNHHQKVVEYLESGVR